MIRDYFTLAEMFLEGDDFLEKNRPFAFKGLTPEKGLYDLINAIAGKQVGQDDEYTKKLLSDFIWPEMWNENVWYIDNGHTEEKLPFEKAKFAGLFWRMLEETKERYEYLIKAYEDNADKLLGEIKSKTSTFFNDTPQSAEEVSYDDFVTNATTTTTSSDVSTMMMRLDEIRRRLWSLYSEWADKFKAFVIARGI